MKQQIVDLLMRATEGLGIVGAQVKIDYPENSDHGDFSSNVAMAYAKQLGMKPKELAEKIVQRFDKGTTEQFIKEVTIAGPGFINFKVKDELFAKEVIEIAKETKLSPQTDVEQVIIEYTDPNTFKAFHVGHIMANTIGESISRLLESSGTEIVRICYPSDIGLHIAKSIWAMQQHLGEIPSEAATIIERTAFLGKMYVEGTKKYDDDPTVKNEIDELNQAIYDRSDDAVNDLYDKGRQWSLDHFEMLYALLGTKFDKQIFESEMAPVGLKIVKENIKDGVFEESDGAIVFKGEEYGLHTRVFINSRGLPTYETKDVGLNLTKFAKYPDATKSIIVTANEQNDYFKVLVKVLSLIDEKNGDKTMHIGHGMLRFTEGKMSSRTGNVVTADALIADMKKMVMEKLAQRELPSDEADEIADTIAVGAIKYTILRQAIGGNVVFDSAASISFEGDSGPYLQYSAVRAQSVLGKVVVAADFGSPAELASVAPLSSKADGRSDSPRASKISATPAFQLPGTVGELERLIVRFDDIVLRARNDHAPQIVANYLIALAGAFNAFYANQIIIDEKDPLSAYRVEVTRAFQKTITRGLWLLGIKVPKRM